jgi:release factor glutamine methyltransferase
LRAAGCVYAEDEARILTEAATSPAQLQELLDRRASGEPLEYIVGWAEFCGLRIPLCSGVFVPRRRSEFLAECAVRAVRAAARSRSGSRQVKVVDVCCGSGAIGLAVATQVADIELLATDNSPLAVACARDNLQAVGGHVFLGDLFDPIDLGELCLLDVVVANAPYVPTDEIARLPAEARLYEPMNTLDGGPDGTSVQRRILASAGDWLQSSGIVLIETERQMSARTARIATHHGFLAEIRESAELDATVVIATLPG